MRAARAATSTAAAGLVVFLLGGCDDGGDATRAATTVETTTTTAAPTADPAEARCSAAGSDTDVQLQPGLPQAVADIRQQIVTAAVACDYDALEALAADGGGFTYSFGDGGDPSSFWRRQEAGRDGDLGPLGFLAGLLDRPHGVEEHDGTVRYVWPSAFSYRSWSDVPEADRAALAPLYGHDDLESFARFGAYVGHRVVIEEDGTWTAFVAGD